MSQRGFPLGVLFVSALAVVTGLPRPVEYSSAAAVGIEPAKGCTSEAGSSAICPKPPPPGLPAAGGSYRDPTFGAKIVRITDPKNAPRGAAVNSASSDSMFNADGTMFYLSHVQKGWFLYAVNRTSGEIAAYGLLPTAGGVGLGYDGARWDPINRSVLYAITVDRTRRELCQLNMPLGLVTVLHDFSREIPSGGYPSSRIQVSADGRYFAVTASSFGGQDDFDYVVVWDRQTKATKVLNTKVRLGAYLHSMEMDNSGEYIRLGTSSTQIGSVFWHWRTDVLSAPLPIGRPEYFGGHKVFGWQVVMNQGRYSDAWLIRSLATPRVVSTALTYPRKAGKVNWFEDSHATRVLSNDSFFDTRYIESFRAGTFKRVGATSVYRLAEYLGFSADFDVPEVVRYKRTALQKASAVPNVAGQWFYNRIEDTLYVWLPDGANPQSDRGTLHFADWRPMTEEIVQILKASDGSWTWRRLAHTRMHYDGTFDTSPRGNADPTGSFVLFQSNWDGILQNSDGSNRTDVFMLVVPTDSRFARGSRGN